VILGPMIDSNYRRAMLGADQNIGQFFIDLITNPISCVLIIFLLIMIGSQITFVKDQVSKLFQK
jgi:putative tricarboxylic transport membrane protein